MFNRDRNFEVGIPGCETINSAIIEDFQGSRVLTSIPWRHSRVKFSDESRPVFLKVGRIALLGVTPVAQIRQWHIDAQIR